jgi:hypothetical protein
MLASAGSAAAAIAIKAIVERFAHPPRRT